MRIGVLRDNKRWEARRRLEEEGRAQDKARDVAIAGLTLEELKAATPAMIKAAPDMYKALRILSEVYNISKSSSDCRELPDYWQNAIKAIAKADRR